MELKKNNSTMLKWLLVIMLFGVKANAQLPVQLFVGEKAAEYNFFWYSNIDSSGKWNLFNFTYFTVNYEQQQNNAYEIYQVATYQLNRNWGITGGGRFTSGKFVPQIAISYEYSGKNLYLNLFPAIQPLPNQTGIGYSLFGLVTYTPAIRNHWDLFSQLAFEPLFNKNNHVYSYQQLRLGLGYKKQFQFGLGVNYEQLGEAWKWKNNYGVFIRKELFNR